MLGEEYRYSSNITRSLGSRGFSHQLTVFTRNFGTPSTSTTLPKQGMSGAIHNKNQSNSLFIHPSLIALRGNVCKVSFCLEWSANFTNLLNVVKAQNLCFSLQRTLWTLWFLIQKMEFLFCCAVLGWIRASWRYLHIWPDRSSRISSTFSAR